VKKDFSETKGSDLRYRRAIASELCGEALSVLRDEITTAIAVGDRGKHLGRRLPRKRIAGGND